MSRFDDRLTQELERAATPAEPAGVFEEIDRRRARRATVRRVQTALLATVVFAGSIGGVLVLNRAFRGDVSTVPAAPLPANGAVVVVFGDDGGTHLYLQDPDDATWDPRDHQLTEPSEVMHDGQPTVSPDGRTVVFVRYDPATLRTSLWSVGIDGTDAHLISPEQGLAPAFAPDGSTIAITGKGRPDDDGVRLMDPDGTDVRTVPDTDASMQSVAWSPDGSSLAVDAQGERHTVTLIGVDGTGRTDLRGTASNTDTQPAWSPDGSAIAFVRDHDIWLSDPAGEDIRQLTTFPVSDGGDMAPTWSPDGSFIAFERYFSPSERFLYVIEPDGSGLRRIGLGGAPAWAAAQPEPSPTEPTPTDTASPEPQGPGRDIGLGFDLCRLQPLRGIDFLGDGTQGTAWVGTQLDNHGSCPSEYEGQSVVAVDVDGDGLAESWAGPLASCVGCSPFDVTDLNADGIQEIVVTTQYSSTPEYALFSLQPARDGGPPVLQEVTVAEPGLLPNYRATKPFTFFSGGDEGFVGYVSCEGYPTDPVLVITRTDHPVEGPGSETTEVETVRLRLRLDATIEVIDSNSYTEPTSYRSSSASTKPACGIDFWPGV
jgi:Tol biopolymer transport system component